MNIKEPTMTRVPIENLIDILIEKKYPWEWAITRQRMPPGYRIAPTISHEDQITAEEKVAAYEAELMAKSFDEQVALYEWELEQEEQQRFFNRPDANADFEFWSKMVIWTLDEAIALVFGKAPEVVRWEKVKRYTEDSPFAKKYEQVRNLALRAVKSNQLNDPTPPSDFLAWAKKLEIEVPHKLIEQVEKWGALIPDWKARYDKIKVENERLTKQLEQLREEYKQTKAASTDEQSLMNSKYGQELNQRAARIINEYPAWKRQVRKVQKTGNLQDWLVDTMGADNREAEILKKVLSDFFNELK